MYKSSKCQVASRASWTDLKVDSNQRDLHDHHHLTQSLSASSSDSFRYTMSKLCLLLPAVLMLLCVWVSLGEASPVKCCTNYSLNPLPVNRLKHFSRQDSTTVCRLNAVIFTTVKNRKICANPDDPWVKNAVDHLMNQRKTLSKTELNSDAI